MTIFLAAVAAILLFGMRGDKDAQNRRNFTYGFIAAVFAIIAVIYWG